MQVRDMRRLLKGLPSDMEVLINLDETIISACKEKSEVCEIEIDDELEFVLILTPCGCNTSCDLEISSDEINLN